MLSPKVGFHVRHTSSARSSVGNWNVLNKPKGLLLALLIGILIMGSNKLSEITFYWGEKEIPVASNKMAWDFDKRLQHSNVNQIFPQRLLKWFFKL